MLQPAYAYPFTYFVVQTAAVAIERDQLLRLKYQKVRQGKRVYFPLCVATRYAYEP
jgi:hypothetical protein